MEIRTVARVLLHLDDRLSLPLYGASLDLDLASFSNDTVLYLLVLLLGHRLVIEHIFNLVFVFEVFDPYLTLFVLDLFVVGLSVGVGYALVLVVE